MRKISLKLDALAVESFQTAETSHAAGTVQGRQDGDPLQAETILCNTGDGMTCPRARSDYLSCIAYCRCTDAARKCYDPHWEDEKRGGRSPRSVRPFRLIGVRLTA